MAKRIPCTACKDVWGPDKARCHECRGVGYTEVSECTAGKAWKTACPWEFDIATGGWECPKCGESGPL